MLGLSSIVRHWGFYFKCSGMHLTGLKKSKGGHSGCLFVYSLFLWYYFEVVIPAFA